MKRLHQYKLKQINKKLFKKATKKKKSFYHNFLYRTRGSIFAKEIRRYKFNRPKKRLQKDRKFVFCSWWRDKKFMQELDKVV